MAAQEKLDKIGLIGGFVSYTLWGIFPIYWKLLSHRPAFEVLAHRMLWSFVFYLILFTVNSRRDLKQLLQQSKRDWLHSALAALFLTYKWGVYIYAVNSGQILDGSLAYFINPILNVVAGVLFFKETFHPVLKIAVFFASIGVAIKIYYSNGIPWIALTLAFSFCTYGIIKKGFKIPARTSSVLEGAIGIIPAIAILTYFKATQTEPTDLHTFQLLVAGGIITGLPLFLFSLATQRIPYSIMGMLQFIAPSLQFAVAIYMYHEKLEARDLYSFALIWIGISFYISYQLMRSRNTSASVLTR